MGHPVAHSRSPMIHGYWLKTLGIPGAYELKDLTPDAFVPFITDLAANGYVGGNVTVPHKEAAFRSVHGRDEAAEAGGAVNTLWLENGKLMGGNSDTHRFIANLDDRAPGWDVAGCRAVVLGEGGAGRSAGGSLHGRTVDGLGMLLQQAGFGFRKWFGGNPKVTPELRAMVEADILK